MHHSACFRLEPQTQRRPGLIGQGSYESVQVGNFLRHISGGLGTACYGITKALTGLGVDIIFVLPRAVAKQYVEDHNVQEPP